MTTKKTNTTTNFTEENTMKTNNEIEALREENRMLKLEAESVYLDDSFTKRNVPIETKTKYPECKKSNKNAIVLYHYNTLLALANKYIYSYGLQGRVENGDLANEAVVYLLDDRNFEGWLNKAKNIQYLSFVSKAVKRLMITPLARLKGYDLFENNEEYSLPCRIDHDVVYHNQSRLIEATESLSKEEFKLLIEYGTNGLKKRAKHIVQKGKEIFQMVKEFLLA